MNNEENKTEEKKEEQPLSIVEEAKKIHDEILKTKEELKSENDRRERLQADELLGGTSGGHVQAKQISPEEQKKQQAAEFFKGTSLEEAIKKT